MEATVLSYGHVPGSTLELTGVVTQRNEVQPGGGKYISCANVGSMS